MLAGSVKRRTLLAAAAALPARAEQIAVVAAENVYADIARLLAGPEAAVTSILNNPDQDPHLFEASPSVARVLSAARIVIYNGADYDPWMATLLRAGRAPHRRVIVVAELVGRKPGDNPHLWYDPTIVLAAARSLSAALSASDPSNKAANERRLRDFIHSIEPLQAKIAAMRAKFAGTPVTATEPVFGYMAAALGLTMRNERLQLAIMNGTEPRSSDLAAFEADLRTHQVRALLYNSQASSSAAKRLLDIARLSGVPVIPVTETQPGGQTYVSWMTSQLDALDAALAKSAS